MSGYRAEGGTPQIASREAIEATAMLEDLLQEAGIPRRHIYRPGEICQILRISYTTLSRLCELAEHPASPHQPPQGLPAMVLGSQRRITHAALLAWVKRNIFHQRYA